MITNIRGESVFQARHRMAERAKLRPDNYEQLSPQEQWEADKKLGILDWDGKDDSEASPAVEKL